MTQVSNPMHERLTSLYFKKTMGFYGTERSRNSIWLHIKQKTAKMIMLCLFQHETKINFSASKILK